jgi:hypothetical protein
MRRLLSVLATGLAALFLVVGVSTAQDTKSVRGKVVKVTGDAITVSVMGKDMTFTVDQSTKVIAEGGSTAVRTARAEGKPGPSVEQLIKAGEGVELRYNEMEGKMHAVEIRQSAVSDEGEVIAAPASASGAILSIATNSITIKGEAEWTFAITAKSTVVGEGVGTQARAMKREGQPLVITEFLGVGDEVTVTYVATGDKKEASEVRVTKRAKR